MKSFKYILLTAAVLSFTACEDFLDEPQPAASLPSATAFTTAQDLQTGLFGAYSLTQQSDGFGTNFVMLPSVLSDEGVWQGSFTSYQDIFNLMTTVNNGEVLGMWDDTYEVVNHANLVIQASGQVEDPALTQDLRDQYRGEGLFLRGAALFEAVRWFALPYNSDDSANDPGIPILTEPVETFGDVTRPTRNSVEEVYNQAISDMEEAMNLLPDFIERGRANRFAAMAYRAEIAFQQRDYGTVVSMTDELVNNSPYALNEDPLTFYINEGSDEEIFAIIHTTQDNPGVNGSLPAFTNVNGRGGDLIISDEQRAAYEAVIPQSQRDAIAAQGDSVFDLRVTQLTSNDVTNIEKYEDPGNNSDDAPIHRLAEFFLMRAEALARDAGSVSQEAVDLLNAVRTRSIRVVDATGAPVANAADLVSYEISDFADVDEFAEAVILERQVEMCYEGSRFHDLMRLSRDARGVSSDDNFLRFPIPQADLDANPNLTQNPGY